MQTIIDLICAIIIVVTIPMGVMCIIETIRAKQDNMYRLEREILRHRMVESYENGLALSPRTMDALYREYKSIGGNGYLTQLYTPTEYKPKHISPHAHNCINCGAPLRKDQHKCEYCGTEYF